MSNEPWEIENEICEAVGCFAKTATSVIIPVGEFGIIKLSVCEKCKLKFADSEFVLRKRMTP